MKLPITILSLLALPAVAQHSAGLHPRLQSLKTNYDSALARATAPLTETYLKELDRLKIEFTKSGDLKAALEVDTILKSIRSPREQSDADFHGLTLSKLSLNQFKAWISTVTITEVESPYNNHYEFIGERMISIRGDTTEKRVHENATVAVGKLFVPFTSTNATITIDESLTKAEISYSTGGRYEGRITKR
jgi:hypothetical protein